MSPIHAHRTSSAIRVHRTPRHRRTAFARQRGVALVIALILILIMSLLGSFAIRNATQSERSINGIRTAEVGREAAETALRFCEQVAMFDNDGKDYTEYDTASQQLRGKIIATTIASEADSDASWRSASNWAGNNVIKVPEAYYKKFIGGSADTKTPQLATAPRCLIQKIQSTAIPQLNGYLVTARGFANNARFNESTGKTTQGAEAWLQSVLTRN